MSPSDLIGGHHLRFQDSELPAKHLLHDENVADKISRRLLQPTSGKVSCGANAVDVLYDS